MSLLPRATLAAPQPFPSLSAPPSYLFVLLLAFTVLILATALVTEALTSLMLRLYDRLESSTTAVIRAESLSSDVLQASPSPAALVYADTFKIAQASQSFLHHLMVGDDDLLNQTLFGVAAFTYPEVIEELITGTGGEVPLAAYRVDGELRVARVRVDPISHGGRRYAYVTIQDVSDLQYLQMALNAVDTVLIVIAAGQVRYFNRAAKHLFADLEPGLDAAAPLGRGNLPEGWWELGTRTRQERQVEFAGERYAASCVATRVLGERDSLTVLSLDRAGRAS